LTTSGRQLNEAPLILNNTNVDGYSLYSQSNGTGTFAVSTSGTVTIGDVATSPNIAIRASDGGATFAGTIVSGNDATANTGNGITLAGGTGEISARRTADSANYLFSGYNTVDNSRVASIAADGSATFATGAFRVDSLGIIQTNVFTVGNIKIDSSADFDNPNISLSAGTGAASFAGAVTALDLSVTSSSGNKFQANGDGIYQQSSGANTAVILANGSATFAGVVSAGNRLVANADGVKSGSDNAFISYNESAVVTASIAANGSATFAGAAKAVAAAGAAGGYRHSQTDGGYYLQDDAGNSSIVLYKDGSATFTGTVTAASFVGDGSGLTGVAGTPGATGPQGPPGTNGTDGSTGATGPQGPQGPQGNSGSNGSNGSDGSNFNSNQSYTWGATQTFNGGNCRFNNGLIANATQIGNLAGGTAVYVYATTDGSVLRGANIPSDGRSKTATKALTTTAVDIGRVSLDQLCSYEYLNDTEGAQTHIGVVAQNFEAALTSAGVDPDKLGVVRDAFPSEVEGESAYKEVLYAEMSLYIIKYQQSLIENLTSRVESLEA
jgi:hypothetical protein